MEKRKENIFTMAQFTLLLIQHGSCNSSWVGKWKRRNGKVAEVSQLKLASKMKATHIGPEASITTTFVF